MEVLGIGFYILALLIGLAFTIRIATEAWKIIYSMAPIIISIIICVSFVIAFGDINTETEVKDADHIESIENQSGRGGN